MTRWKMPERMVSLLILLLAGTLLQCGGTEAEKAQKLIITDDFGAVRRCGTVEAVTAVARTIISARPDIVALDATANGLVNYRSEIGFFVPGGNVDSLLRAGLEPYQMIVDTLRDHGITVLANVRMNDHHGALPQWTAWEREHTGWSLGKDTGARDWKSIGALRQMDYAIEGVRAYRFSILSEILAKFAVDGLQLDFGRTVPFLSEPKTKNARFLTEYVRSVRHLLDDLARSRDRGRLLLGVVVPWDADACAREGLEVRAWAEEGLIDYLSPGEWYYADWNIPLDRWKEIVRKTDCRLYPFTPGNVSPYQVFEYGEPSLLGENRVLDGPKLRAIADNFLAQNSDGFALYNFYTFDFGQYYPDLRAWTDPRNTVRMSKHYFNCRRLIYHANERETFDQGVAFERTLLRKAGDRAERRFRFSADPGPGGATLRCAFKEMEEGDEITVRVNGALLAPDTVTPRTAVLRGDRSLPVRFWSCSIGMPPLRSGENVIEWELAKRIASQPIAVGEFEIFMEPQQIPPHF